MITAKTNMKTKLRNLSSITLIFRFDVYDSGLSPFNTDVDAFFRSFINRFIVFNRSRNSSTDSVQSSAQSRKGNMELNLEARL